MKIELVTAYNKVLFDRYAHRFNETYCWKFPCYTYHEDNIDSIIDKYSYGKDGKTPFFYRHIFEEAPNCKLFVERNKHRKYKNFLFDAVRFSYKVYSYTHAILNSDADGIIWIDADSVFYKPIDEDWIKEHIYSEDCMITYLGRGSQYSECGFLYFNMKHPKIKDFALAMKEMYDKDLIYNEIEQHDSYIFDVVRKRFEVNFDVQNHNIGDQAKAHVQARSILGTVYDHTKGNRKESGVSPEWLRRNR